MRMERKNSLRDSAVGSPDCNLKNSKHSGSLWIDYLEICLLFFSKQLLLALWKEKSWSFTRDALSEEILYCNILLFRCWKLSSTSYFIVFTSNTLPPARKFHKFEWKSQIWSSLPILTWNRIPSEASRTSTAVRNKLEAWHNRISKGTDDYSWNKHTKLTELERWFGKFLSRL